MINLLQIYLCYYLFLVKFSKTTANMRSPYPLNNINQNNQRIQFPLDDCLLILFFTFLLFLQLSGLGPQVIWAAKLLFTNPYSEILKDHFTHVKQAWLRKVEQLRGLFLTSADLRTYQKNRGTSHTNSTLCIHKSRT